MAGRSRRARPTGTAEIEPPCFYLYIDENVEGKEFADRNAPPKDEDDVSVHTDYQDFDASKHNPVFYGKMHQRLETDIDVMKDVDTSASHPSCVGYIFTEKPPDTPPPPPIPPPHKDKCSPREYLEHYVFPWLLPALEDMLRQAKKEKCLERKRTAFNALDYITEHLYKNNIKYTDRQDIKFEKIPFVQKHWETHPRAPLPLSLIWTEEEAALVIQSQFRGFLVRREPEVQELRQWQKEWREENQGIKTQVSAFWDKKMPDWNQPTPSVSQDNIVADSKQEKIEPEQTGQPPKPQTSDPST